MNCQDAKRLMALHIGQDDADVSDWESVRRHASLCLDCRKHYRGLKQTMSVLENADTESTYEVRDSLWPEIESRLDQSKTARHSRSARNWTPLISFTVASVLFLMVAAFQPDTQHRHGELQHSLKGMGPFPMMSPHHDHSDEQLAKDRSSDSEDDAL